jgi:hypothetical protein
MFDDARGRVEPIFPIGTWRFPLVLLSEPRDASDAKSAHSCSVIGNVLAAPAPLIAQVPRAPRRCLPAFRDTHTVARLAPNRGPSVDHVG